MKILAFSDIHNNLGSVRKLRHLESNDYDAVVVAGDMGCNKIDEFFELVSSFDCPVLYICGNADYDLEYDRSFGAGCTHLHLNPVELDGFVFAGFSGCNLGWGRNSFAQTIWAEYLEEREAALAPLLQASEEAKAAKHPNRKNIRARYRRAERQMDEVEKQARKAIEAANRQALLDALKSVDTDPNRLVLVTHERQFRVHEDMPNARLHLFGHRHGFKHTAHKGVQYVNVSALDQLLMLVPKGEEPYGAPSEIMRKVNAGTYAVIEMSGRGDVKVECRKFWKDAHDEWDVSKYGCTDVVWLAGEEPIDEEAQVERDEDKETCLVE